jgi:hypothetical protein
MPYGGDQPIAVLARLLPDVRTCRAFLSELSSMLGVPRVSQTRVEDAFTRIHREDVARVRGLYEAAFDPEGNCRLGSAGSMTRAGGAILLNVLTESLRVFSEYRLWVYTLLLVFILFFMPQGLVAPLWQRIRRLFR